MHTIISFKLPFEKYLQSLNHWMLANSSDALLSRNASLLGDNRSIVGIEPTDTLVVRPKTCANTLRTFANQDTRPTLGYLSYDYGLYTQGLRSTQSSNEPLGILKKYNYYLTYNHNESTVKLQSIDPKRKTPTFLKSFVEPNKPFNRPDIKFTSSLKASMSQAEYESAVREVIRHIEKGNTYQLNLSIAFSAQTHFDKWHELWLYLFQNNPADYYAYLRAEGHTFISTSPESFLKVRDRLVTSSPIKGTAHITEKDDPKAEHKKLQSCPKENAELSMVVDLMRNDIAYACKPGSIKVKDHKKIFKVDRLLQMYSKIEGELKNDSDIWDLLTQAFPGGSITGVPKKRAMEIIDTLEPHKRSAYSGTFFVAYDDKNLDSSIAIRTADYDAKNALFSFYAGSGLTIHSNPQKEYREALAKAEKFTQLIVPEPCPTTIKMER